MGNQTTPALRQEIADHGYNYGEVMAQKGFITYAIDWIGFGERNDSQKPNHLNVAGNRDWCNLYYLHATMFGMTSLSINVAHGKVATDVISTFPNVDSERLGVMGLSGGGTMALWMTLCDERVKASEIICYSDLWWPSECATSTTAACRWRRGCTSSWTCRSSRGSSRRVRC